jgi:diguanylate cyclase
MDFWNIDMPAPVALALVCVLGYLVGRRQRKTGGDLVMRSRRELNRAKAVAAELEKIAWTVRQSLAKHHTSVNRFRERVSRLNNRHQDSAWKDLCREAEEILKPTLQLATQIANAYDEIRQQSANLMTFTEVRTDPLTGVNNRRGMDDALATQFAMMARYDSGFSLTLFDIDHFKLINDKEGHVHGDHVLQELARLLDESIRETDLIARYGGEEFVVVMPQTDLAGASAFSERLRAKVENKLSITVSGGVATAHAGDTAESIIARADTALYGAKLAGRNRVYFHDGNATQLVVPEEAVSNLACGNAGSGVWQRQERCLAAVGGVADENGDRHPK